MINTKEYYDYYEQNIVEFQSLFCWMINTKNILNLEFTQVNSVSILILLDDKY